MLTRSTSQLCSAFQHIFVEVLKLRQGIFFAFLLQPIFARHSKARKFVFKKKQNRVSKPTIWKRFKKALFQKFRSKTHESFPKYT